MKKNRFFALVLALILAMACAVPAFAEIEQPENFPKKIIRLLIPYAAGGNSDMNARLLAELIDKYNLMPEKVIVTNMQGSNTAECFNSLMTSDPDGYTLVLQHTALLTLPAFGIVNFTMDDVEPVCEVLEQPFFVFASADAPYNNTAELKEWCEQNPDQKIVWGHPGIGSSGQMGAEVYLDQTGLRDNMLFVQYGGGGDSLTAHLGGECELRGGFATDGMRYVESGELKVIAVSGNQRVDALPDVECFAELGFEKNYLTRQGVWATKGTPEEIVNYLAEVFMAACDTDEYRSYLAAQGCIEAVAGPEGWRELMANDFEMIKGLVDELGLAVN